MPKLGFGRRRSSGVLDGELGEWSLDNVKPGFAPSRPRASGLLSWGPQVFAGVRDGISHELQLSNREAEAHHVSCTCSKLYFLDSVPSWVNCRGFFGLLFSYPFGLFIPRVLDT